MTVLITGAASSIGKALAFKFQEEGYNLLKRVRQVVILCLIVMNNLLN